MKEQSLVIFAPLPPKENGIADYVYEQLPYHAAAFERLVVVVDNAHPAPASVPANVTVLRLAEYLRSPAAYAGMPHLYHVGNNPDHGYMLPVLYERGGVVVIHDLSLHHLVDSQTLGKGNVSGYAYALWQQYGRAGKRLGEGFTQYRLKGRFMQHELPFSGAVIDAADRVIVHSRFAVDSIGAYAPDKPVAMIPHHLSPAVARYNSTDRTAYRRELGLPEKGLLITSLGFITRAKQIHTVLEVLARLKNKGVEFTYVLAGKCRTVEYDVYHDIRVLGLEDHVRVTGFVGEDDFFKHVAASDLILNLRYPTSGETSGTLTRALGMGRCCVVVDIGSFSEIPDDCAVKLPWGAGFANDLEQAIAGLLSDESARFGYEECARNWGRERHAIGVTTEAYRRALRHPKSPRADAFRQLLGQPGVSARMYIPKPALEAAMKQNVEPFEATIAQGGGHLWWRECLLPRAGGDDLLLIADNEAARPLLERLWSYPPEQIVHLSPSALDPDALSVSVRHTYRMGLVFLSLRAIRHDPVPVMAALSWRIQLGGEVIITLRYDIADELDVDTLTMTPVACCDYLEAAGFQVLSRYSVPEDATCVPLMKAPIEWCFRVRKIGDHVERYPRPWYSPTVGVQLHLRPGTQFSSADN